MKQLLVSGIIISLQHVLRPVVHILNKVVDDNIALVVNFVNAVDNSSLKQLRTNRPIFCNFVHFPVVK